MSKRKRPHPHSQHTYTLSERTYEDMEKYILFIFLMYS